MVYSKLVRNSDTHLWRDDGNLQRLILQDAGAVCVEADEVAEGKELPPPDVVVAAVGVDLEVMHVPRPAQVGDGVVARLGLALADQVGAWIADVLQTGARRLSADAPVVPPVNDG